MQTEARRAYDRERRRRERQDPAFLEREYALARARTRRPCPVCGGPKPGGSGRKTCDDCKLGLQAARVVCGALARAARPKPTKVVRTVLSPSERGRRGAKVRWANVPRPAPRPRVPAEVRAAWRNSHPNSVIRRKFPTMAALEARWGQ